MRPQTLGQPLELDPVGRAHDGAESGQLIAPKAHRHQRSRDQRSKQHDDQLRTRQEFRPGYRRDGSADENQRDTDQHCRDGERFDANQIVGIVEDSGECTNDAGRKRNDDAGCDGPSR
jgi:hypothetical protein